MISSHPRYLEPSVRVCAAQGRVRAFYQMTDSLHSFSAARLYARPEEAPTLLLRVSVRKAHLTQCLSCAKPISAVLERLRKKAGKVLGPGAQVSLVSADRELVDPSLSCDSTQFDLMFIPATAIKKNPSPDPAALPPGPEGLPKMG